MQTGTNPGWSVWKTDVSGIELLYVGAHDPITKSAPGLAPSETATFSLPVGYYFDPDVDLGDQDPSNDIAKKNIGGVNCALAYGSATEFVAQFQKITKLISPSPFGPPPAWLPSIVNSGQGNDVLGDAITKILHDGGYKNAFCVGFNVPAQKAASVTRRSEHAEWRRTGGAEEVRLTNRARVRPATMTRRSQRRRNHSRRRQQGVRLA